jgi:hemin uptake protein HemP
MENEPAEQVATESRQVLTLSAHTDPPRRISSASLLQGRRQIVIEHVGREYRLHLTAKGKLILTG